MLVFLAAMARAQRAAERVLVDALRQASDRRSRRLPVILLAGIVVDRLTRARVERQTASL